MRPLLAIGVLLFFVTGLLVTVGSMDWGNKSDEEHVRGSLDGIGDAVASSDNVSHWTMTAHPASLSNHQNASVEFDNSTLWLKHQRFVVTHDRDGVYSVNVYDDADAEYDIVLTGRFDNEACADDLSSSDPDVCDHLAPSEWNKVFNVLVNYAKKRDPAF